MQRSPLIYFFLFTVSGFTGLIYESVWSHYLKLFLGHAAYAQVLVLTIFMGGMALGAYLSARLLPRWHNLLLVYAVVECLIGALGVIFDPIFRALLAVSHDSIIPYLETPLLITAYKWAIATAVILPQCVLLGMTFPLMSNGVIRRFPATPGNHLGALYFTNSIGAAVGVLFSGFYLIGAVGLPGTIMAAGIINILLAIVVYGLSARHDDPRYADIRAKGITARRPQIILAAAFITGMASFIYEIVWLRMLSMVLGASTHSFELMLSAFITGLALGGLWIRRRLEHLADPVKTAGWIQIVMGLLALATLPLYNHTFEWMRFLIDALNPNDSGYQLFVLFSHVVCLVVMLPATFCAGMTLPLFTYILLKQGHGEKSVGHVYASNTLGAIAGVTLTILFAMPLLGLKLALIIGCVLDIVLGLYFLARADAVSGKPLAAASAMAGALVISVALLFEPDVLYMNSGVFRTGQLNNQSNSRMLFHKDAKTASIGIRQSRSTSTRVITTNGKPEASIVMEDGKGIQPDEITMVLSGALAVASNPDAKRVANIGIGSGLTAHALLAWPTIERLDTIEIEAAMVEGARYFLPRVERVFTDPRSVIYIEDAKTYFSARQSKYDIIISEPSNPWVSGTASLFTDEFYTHIKRHLNDGGIFVQWLQMYESNPQLFLSVLAALKKNFTDFSMYAVANGDLIFIASQEKPAVHLDRRLFEHAAMRQELARIGVYDMPDLNARFIATGALLAPMIDRFSPAVNSDYFPYLDLHAVRARFKKQFITDDIQAIRTHVVPVIDMLLPDVAEKNDLTGISDQFSLDRVNTKAYQAHHLLRLTERGENPSDDHELFKIFKAMTVFARTCQAKSIGNLWNDYLVKLATLTVPYLTPRQLELIWASITPNCAHGLSDDQRSWFNLMRALGRRDSPNIVRIAEQLLTQQAHWDIEKLRIQFVAQITALIDMGKYHAARTLWVRQIGALYPNQSLPLLLLILYSLMDENTA